MPVKTLLIALLLASLGAASSSEGDPAGAVWPLVTSRDGCELHLYHPQPESLRDGRITARAAFSISRGDDEQPSFGVVWLDARAELDHDARTITMGGMSVSRVLLPQGGDALHAAISEAVVAMLQDLDPVLGEDDVHDRLRESDLERDAGHQLSTATPRIIVVDRPTALIAIDGAPLTEPIADSRFARVVNTPFMLARDADGGAFWLFYAGGWYSAPAIDAAWRLVERAPDEVAALAPALSGFAPDDQPTAEQVPAQILVSQVPAELITSDGPPSFIPIAGTHLLGLENSDDRVFTDVDDQRTYALLAGRWFWSPSFPDGAWTHIESDRLPADFARIPADSRFADARTHVPGTTEAAESVLEAQVPRTAAVDRHATIEVDYDEAPEWRPIDGTSLAYAVDTTYEVIRVSPSDYRCCHQGIWYAAPAPSGPWTVATSVPGEILLIPPTCPLYHVRYVRIYESTPRWVYIGYHPGYVGSYVSGGCVVWGTGYRYQCSWNRYYHPRPCTWGAGMAYDPSGCQWGSRRHAAYTGEHGWLVFGVYGSESAWWGPCGYRQVDLRDRRAQHPVDSVYHRPARPSWIHQDRPAAARPAYVSAHPSKPEPHDGVPGQHGDDRRPGTGWEQWHHGGSHGTAPSSVGASGGTTPAAPERPHTKPDPDHQRPEPKPERPHAKPDSDRPRPEPKPERPHTKPDPDHQRPEPKPARPHAKPDSDRPRPEPKPERPQAKPDPDHRQPEAKPERPHVKPDPERPRPETKPDHPRAKPDHDQQQPEPEPKPERPHAKSKPDRPRPDPEPERPRARPEPEHQQPEAKPERPGGKPDSDQRDGRRPKKSGRDHSEQP